MASKLIWHTTMSLDGFVAAPDEDRSWVFELDAGDGGMTRELIPRLGALLVGRNTMRVEDREQPGFYGGAYTGPFVVLTHHPESEPPLVKGVAGSWCSGPIADAVDRARELAGDKDVAVLGARTATQCIRAGLLDELLIHVAPILLGDGIPLFRRARHRLDLIESRREGELTTLRLAVRKAPV